VISWRRGSIYDAHDVSKLRTVIDDLTYLRRRALQQMDAMEGRLRVEHPQQHILPVRESSLSLRSPSTVAPQLLGETSEVQVTAHSNTALECRSELPERRPTPPIEVPSLHSGVYFPPPLAGGKSREIAANSAVLTSPVSSSASFQ
jgi:hypothetical protein